MKQKKKLNLGKTTILKLNLVARNFVGGGTETGSGGATISGAKACNTSVAVPNTMKGLPFPITSQ
jgi:hypothetical protein